MQDLSLHIEIVMLKQSVGLFICTCINFNIGRISLCVRCYNTDVTNVEGLNIRSSVGRPNVELKFHDETNKTY